MLGVAPLQACVCVGLQEDKEEGSTHISRSRFQPDCRAVCDFLLAVLACACMSAGLPGTIDLQSGSFAFRSRNFHDKQSERAYRCALVTFPWPMVLGDAGAKTRIPK